VTDGSTPSERFADIDIVGASRYGNGIPWDDFRKLRARPGLHWNRYEAEPHANGGFWAVTRHADVCEVSRHPERFSSAIGHVNLWDLEADALEARRSILEHDPPAHTRLRRVVSKAFTPRQMRRYTERTRAIADELLDVVVERGGGDWVELVAAPLPIRVIIAILGVPPEDADCMVELSNHLVEGTTETQSLPPDAYGNTTPLRLLPFGSPAAWGLYEYGAKLGDERLEHPTDDVVSHLVHAEVGGVNLVVDDGGVETLDMLGHLHHQLRPLQGRMSPGPVLDLRRGGELTPHLDTGDERRLEIGPGGIEGGRVARGAGAKNDEPVMLGHGGTDQSKAAILPSFKPKRTNGPQLAYDARTALARKHGRNLHGLKAQGPSGGHNRWCERLGPGVGGTVCGGGRRSGACRLERAGWRGNRCGDRCRNRAAG